MELLGLLKKTLRPEFLNRIDETIMFTPLSREDVKKIVEIQMNDLVEQMKAKDIHLAYQPEIVDHIAELGFDPQFGARPIKRIIQRNVLNTLSKELLSGKVSRGSTTVLDVFDGLFVFRDQIERERKEEAES